MTFQWRKSALAAALLGTMTLAACATSPDGDPATGLYDPSSANTQSVPYDVWFKDRPQ